MNDLNQRLIQKAFEKAFSTFPHQLMRFTMIWKLGEIGRARGINDAIEKGSRKEFPFSSSLTDYPGAINNLVFSVKKRLPR